MGKMIDEKDLKRKVKNLLLLVFLELYIYIFLSMLPSMSKGEIVGSMNVDDTFMSNCFINMIRSLS